MSRRDLSAVLRKRAEQSSALANLQTPEQAIDQAYDMLFGDVPAAPIPKRDVYKRQDDLFIANISRKNFSNATWKATGIEMTDSGSGAKDRFNESGVTYRYIAFR